MKLLISSILVLITFSSFSQELSKIKVTVPNKTDEVFITGNQENLGNWKPDKIKLNRVSEFEREISLDLSYPSEFKFTRGSWETEGYTSNYWEVKSNLKITGNTSTIYSYKILSWKDSKQDVGSFNFDFKITNNFSPTFNETRTIGIKLPNNYNPLKKYPVVYVLDANTLLKPFLLSIELLSEKFIGESGTDYGRDNIPEIIIVGVFHNNRGYETEPKFDYSTDKSLYLKGSEKLKNYLFNELVPMINSQYQTSEHNSIVGHSNTGHLVLNLPFFNNNPFKNIVALSVNSESEYFKNMIFDYVKTSKENVFLGYGTLDDGFNELGEKLNDKIKNNEISNSNLKVESFEGSHNQLPALATSSSVKFLFRHYKNFTNFNYKSSLPDFSISKYCEEYKEENKKYGLSIDVSSSDLFNFAEKLVKRNNIELFRKVIEYSNNQNDKIPNHLIFWLSLQCKDYETSDKMIEIISKTEIEEDYYHLYADFPLYSNYLLQVKKSPDTLFRLINHMYENSEEYKLEFSYYCAKVLIESNTQKSKSKSFLQFCRKNFKENRIFKLEDLDMLSTKR
ncbi:alpha/beta hydrolase-fold protein [Aquirufa regiilacus]|uniref:Alpha/beta hydrolase-fold protein n=1 Tax=Aquirufa regiilacus TaxID=3024868 RepID=A0ABU3TTS0_9BACT|nr:alpha/beta hydrolase-fold protein [Aquirufa sp. LEOWEIH-7C]MDU0809249.1 alpha/beta hydrolase-fold protein [Aquirufa sp. LEOWEIH-7C]